MSKPTVFIDGHVGTTGLVIHDSLARLGAVELITLPEAMRKDPDSRREAINSADIAILCLPDAAAIQAVSLIDNPVTRVLDASSAHRIAPDWVYGLAEMTGDQPQKIAEARRVANPGCYPTTPVLALRPLIEEGLLAASAPVTVYGLSGYSGGGNTLIDRWQDCAQGLAQLPFPAPYALSRIHKHIPEMTRYTGLEQRPHFIPAVGAFRCGMRVTVALHRSILASGAGGEQIWQLLNRRYENSTFVRIAPYRESAEPGELDLDPRAFNATNTIELSVYANPDGHVVLIGRLDNLGKGAGGAALQNLNLMLGLPEQTGLEVAA